MYDPTKRVVASAGWIHSPLQLGPAHRRHAPSHLTVRVRVAAARLPNPDRRIREYQRHASAARRIFRKRNSSAMALHDFIGDAQAQPGPAPPARTVTFGAEESLSQPGLRLGRDAWSVIDDVDFNRRARSSSGHADLPSG